MITGYDLTLRRGRRDIVAGVTIELAPGSLTALVGPSGAGKSSLLRLLAGDLYPSRGSVALDGRSTAWYGPLGLARRRAVLPQDAPQDAPFTVLDVVLLGRAPHGDDRTPAGETMARRMLLTVGLAGLERRRYPTLSGGERQRVQLARVLAQLERPGDASPGYLFLDEPTSSLDLGHQQRVLTLARGVARDGGGVLAVLHDLSLAARYADQVVLMCEGRVFADGPPAAVLSAGNLDAAFACQTLVFELDGRIASILAADGSSGNA